MPGTFLNTGNITINKNIGLCLHMEPLYNLDSGNKHHKL